MTGAATVPPSAHGYAHPVENPGDGRVARPVRYGPHDDSRLPGSLTLTCAGRYPLCDGANHPREGRHEITVPVPPSILRQQRALNTKAHDDAVADHLEELDSMYGNEKRAGTEDDPKLYLTGHCDPAGPDRNHRSCRDRYVQRRTVRGSNNSVRTVVELFLCVCPKPCCSDHELQQRARAAAAPPEPVAAGTAWTADEVAELMVELEECPLCNGGWLAHTFTDDDRVVCA